MKKIVLPILASLLILHAQAQTRNSFKKYPSLFWEITGNGLSRPSYLFGTMHVSSKMVFHLPDSFYLAVKSVDVVALETNPESWQEDLVKYDLGDNSSYSGVRYPLNNFKQMPDDYLSIHTLQFDGYEKQIEAALYSRPSTINNLLYRNYSDFSSDFEENTYLDMYIYQVGKKMGKRVAGVEKYEESMKLMMEAYRDAAKEKSRKQKSYNSDDAYSADKLQEAYRTGNLDLLDSINRMNSFSDAFDEKFLYDRNLLQANSIDSILKSKSALFVGVGAAHLPGNRGVIEILRRKGYKLRPIYMGERDGYEKDMVEKLHVPVVFSTQTSDDGFFKVDIPGKFYRFNEDGVLDQLQYADMANGSYYMATRIPTNSGLWGSSEETVRKKIDSLLYENIPGKILNKKEIMLNGYPGIDITNRTRRGDVQRYNILITPYEVIIFKMSGNGDYVKDGEEAKRFFGSIQLKEYNTAAEWKKYQPAYGGFTVDLPHEPFVLKNTNWEYEAYDKTTAANYTILRTDIHNYGFAEEDTFDLNLLDESFSGSEFISKEISRKFITWKGYPALDCKYKHKNGSVLCTRFIIEGPHYYTLIAHGPKESADMQKFLNSFEIKPFDYKQPFEKKDTTLYYSVKTTYYPESKKIKITVPGTNSYSSYAANDADDADDGYFPWGSFKSNIVENDSTGEKIYVSLFRNGRYFYSDDSSGLNENRITKKGSWIIRSKKKYEIPGKWKITEFQLSDTNSSRLVWTKTFYKDGIGFLVAAEGDTLTAPSSFVKNFFETFTPGDTLKGFNPFEKKSVAFFNDYFSNDTSAHKRAVKAIDQVKLDSNDLPNLEKAINCLNWSEKQYLDTKKSLINKLGDINTMGSAEFLKKLYYAEEDTVEVQYAVLESLLQQQTQYAFNVFKDIVTEEPPIIETNANKYNYYQNNLNYGRFNLNLNTHVWDGSNYDNGDFWDELYDSVQLTRTILPDILPLVNLDDYKWKTMRLLGRMVDSNLVQPADYDSYLSKFLIEAKQEFRKQIINEKRKLIQEASQENVNTDEDDNDDDESTDFGNEKLSLYAKLILPFWKSNENVPLFFSHLLQSNDKKLKYGIMMLMIQNKRDVPDSLLNYFAAMDDYRYLLYSDLEDMDQLKLFPKKYNSQADLAKSKLIDSKPYSKPDSVVFIDKLSTEFNTRQGYIYFYKYKDKKDDPMWKLATVGLLSKDLKQFEIKLPSPDSDDDYDDDDETGYYDFTSFTDSKLDVSEPVSMQLNKELKKMLYSRRNSAKEFYDVSKNSIDDISSIRFRN